MSPQREPWHDRRMDVRLITQDGIEERPVADLPALLAEEKALVWVDVPSCDPTAAKVLRDVFGFHPMAVADCVERNRVPKVHAYPDHVFVVLHAPERGDRGHVHYLELDQFVGQNYVVTVHGPLNPAVEPQAALRETGAVLARIRSGRLRPRTPFDLSHAIASALTRNQEAFRAGPQPRRRRTRVPAGRHRVLPDHPGHQGGPRRPGAKRGSQAPHRGQLHTERGGQEDLLVGGDPVRTGVGRHRVRDELRAHAGDEVAAELPGRAGGDGGLVVRAVPSLQTPRLAVSRRRVPGRSRG